MAGPDSTLLSNAILTPLSSSILTATVRKTETSQLPSTSVAGLGKLHSTAQFDSATPSPGATVEAVPATVLVTGVVIALIISLCFCRLKNKY